MKKINRRLVLASSLLINLFIGTIYIWSVFAGPLQHEFEWSASAVALTFTIANGISPVTMITGGKLLDKYGPAGVVFTGGLLFGAGMFATGFVNTVSMLYITYGLIVGFGMGMVYSCTIANTVKFFPDKKGLVSGLTTGAYGLSSVIFAPVAQALIEYTSLMTAFKILGVAVIAVIIVCAPQLKKAPENTEDIHNSTIEPGIDMKWHEMIRTHTFYILLIMLTFGATAGLMIISQASSMAQDIIHVTPGLAAIIVSLLSMANASGRIIWGFIADRTGCFRVLPVMFGISAAMMWILTLSSEYRAPLFIIPIFLIGFCFGGFMSVFPAITSEQFGIKNNGTNYGIMFCGFAAGGLLGPYLASAFRISSLGLYNKAFIISGTLCLAGLCLSIIAKRAINYGKKTKRN